MKCAGIQSSLRQSLSQLLRSSPDLITIDSAATILGLAQGEAQEILFHLARNGWLSRVKRGHYIPVPLSSNNAQPALEYPWAIAARLFEPCYIAGWSAAEYWDFTEQIFNTTLVLTTKQPRRVREEINATKFLIQTIQQDAFYGTKSIWQGQTKVLISDPSKTIVDMFYKPALGGGIRQVAEFYKNYLKSEHKDINLLVEYALKLNKGVVFKRLGFITEKLFPEEKCIIEVASKNLSSGYSKLDISLPQDRLLRKWNLWVSNSWLKEVPL